MKRLAVLVALVSTSVMAETVSGVSNPLGQAITVVQPSCNPIGQTLHGELVFSLGCPVAVTYPPNSGQVPLTNGGIGMPLDNSGQTVDLRLPLTGSGQSGSTPPLSSGGNSKK